MKTQGLYGEVVEFERCTCNAVRTETAEFVSNLSFYSVCHLTSTCQCNHGDLSSTLRCTVKYPHQHHVQCTLTAVGKRTLLLSDD